VKSDISIPSINMFLPIGESDLDNALLNDNIPAVNFRKTEEQYSFDSKSISLLQEKADERRENSKIFDYLIKNIDFVKKIREQKSLSLNLSDRLKERAKENLISDDFKDTYNEFDDLSYPSRDIVLSIVSDQINQSRKARGVEVNDSNVTEKFSRPEDIDISLNETINIMRDFLLVNSDLDSAARKESQNSEI
jgi:carboxyl-terminal processing protease